ncbi:hypothetical protein BJD99_11765 [Rhodococcus sp. 1163]|uniref:DUF3558 domain-containing protein n=1 Tax=Rhodococcus sp. 1163 TaxID=1905289 RepID=UPI000A09DD4B|nr:DUF3558 domain-containing protein [Rhodococcus sp. 1163]ORI13807.1 hypothetical protein BJD99_11765 [Rhodococcus sp. 1163]
MQRRWPAVLAVATMLCACAQPVDGVAVAGFPGVTEQFEPCSIPDDAIAATGLLDLEKQEVGWGDDANVQDWTRCTWAGPRGENTYFFGILASSQYSLSDVKLNPEYVDQKDIQVGGRQAVIFRFDGVRSTEGCDIAFDTNVGLVRLNIEAMGGMTLGGNPCELLDQIAVVLEPILPPSR